jgi:hypothetical protein
MKRILFSIITLAVMALCASGQEVTKAVQGTTATAVSGTGYTALLSGTVGVPARQLTLLNTTGVSIEILRTGAGVAFVLPTGMARLLRGIATTSEISIRRADVSATPVTVYWEAEK